MANRCNMTFSRVPQEDNQITRKHLFHTIVTFPILGRFQLKELDFTQKTSKMLNSANHGVSHSPYGQRCLSHELHSKTFRKILEKNALRSLYLPRYVFLQIIMIKLIYSPLNFFSMLHLYKVSQNSVNKLGNFRC